MIVKNAMQLKALIKNKAAEKNIPAQSVLQNYVMERFLERIARSKYRKNFIVKGDFLISAIVGIDNRTTMDLDATLKGMPLSEENLKNIFTEICGIAMEDNFTFILDKFSPIREDDQYQGWRAYLHANYEPMKTPLTVDITTGDKITPRAVNYSFQLLFEKRSIFLMSYNVETILAEKIETILSRSVANTRPRDFYDVYKIVSLHRKEIDFKVLRQALEKTATKRNSLKFIAEYKTILDDIQNSGQMQKFWNGYSKNNAYAKDMSFDDVCDCVKKIMRKLYS
ncbi:MAG: nucleotidyl transferase AbiEii/AbiGii toxin family protein [Endomicrobium sp.]|nr:nucleotidyl transferase AbiEii/AbiGii toxin family protein [Endomicrobium sp.]